MSGRPGSPAPASPRALLFAPAFPPFGNPEAIVNGKLALALLDDGWQVDVVSRDLPRESGYNYGCAWEEPWTPLRRATHLVRYPGAGALQRGLDTLRAALRTGHLIEGCRWAAHACELGLRLHREARYDVVLSRAGPESAHLAALAFARRGGVRWIANWNDPCDAKMPPPCGGGPDAAEGWRYARFLRAVAAGADVHVFPSERQRAYMTRYLGARAAERSVAVPHVALVGDGGVGAGSADGVFTLCHAGRLSPERRPEDLLDGIALFLQRSGADVALRLRVIGLEDVGLIALAAARGLAGVAVAEAPRGYAATLAEVAASDVALVVEAPCPEGIFLPSKVVDYAQTGRPILAVSPAIGTVADLLGGLGGGVAVPCGSPEAVAAALSLLYGAWREGRLESAFGSARLRPLFDAARIARRYRELAG